MELRTVACLIPNIRDVHAAPFWVAQPLYDWSVSIGYRDRCRWHPGKRMGVTSVMYDRRVNDSDAYSKFRPSRFNKDGGKWYFSTREGTTEGPFELKSDAEARLTTYIKVMASGFLPRNSKLSIQTIDVPNPGAGAICLAASAERYPLQWRTGIPQLYCKRRRYK
jgi:hypothetical protein